MARYTVRIETEIDATTGLLFAEVFYPVNSAKPQVTTPAFFKNEEEAESGVVEAIRKGLIQIKRK